MESAGRSASTMRHAAMGNVLTHHSTEGIVVDATIVAVMESFVSLVCAIMRRRGLLFSMIFF